MKQKKYLVLKTYNRYREGDIVELNKNTAANMLKRGACEEYVEPKTEPKKAPVKKKAAPKKDK
tara:strand:- start:35 stop:223 length:189 start_codon:yes stop_codon:yes gene_type:complete